MTMVYLAGPIDDVTRDHASSWRETVAHMLNERGFGCYDPLGAFRVSIDNLMHNANFIHGMNEAAIRACGYVLVNLTGPGRAIGTIREIEFAARLKKPVVVAIQTSHVHVALHDVKVVGSLTAAVEWIDRHANPSEGGILHGHVPRVVGR